MLVVDLTAGERASEPIERKRSGPGSAAGAGRTSDEGLHLSRPLRRADAALLFRRPASAELPRPPRPACRNLPSPLTGTIFDSSVAEVPLKLKQAGYDAIMITGKAQDPVYLDINETRAVIKDASWLWGKGASR